MHPTGPKGQGKTLIFGPHLDVNPDSFEVLASSLLSQLNGFTAVSKPDPPLSTISMFCQDNILVVCNSKYLL